MVPASPLAGRVLTLAACVACSLAAQERSFRARLDALVERGKAGAAAEAMQGLHALLAEYEGREEARHARFEIETLHRRCAFRLRAKVPAPKDVVSGELISCDLATGAIAIRYPRERLDDWRQEGGLWTLDARFLGPHSIEVRGSRYVPVQGVPGEGARLLVLRDDGVAVRASGGLAGVRGSALVRERGLERVPLAGSETSPLESGKPFRMQLKVGEGSVRLIANGLVVGETKREPKEVGGVAFGYVEFDEVIVEGKAEPAWMQGRLDTAFHDELRRFERHYDPRKELPLWLWTRAPRRGSDQALGEAWPDALDDAQARLVADAERHAALRDFESSLRLLRGHARFELPKATATALQLGVLTSLEKYEEAGAAAALLGELAPGAPLTKVLRAELDLALGRGADAARQLHGLLEVLPTWERLHVDLALARMTLGDLHGAKRGVERAFELGVDGADLAAVNRTLVKALTGPDWSRRASYATPNFEVHSNLDSGTCRRVAELLEGNHVLLQRQLGRAPAAPRAKVLLFAGPDGFHRFVEELWGVRLCPNVCGYYHPLLKQMLVTHDARESEVLATVRHEGLHLFLDRLAPSAPLWLHEGLACYYERKVASGTRFVDLALDRRRVAWLRTHELVPLAEFLIRTPEAFQADAEQSYAQAWAFVSVLLDTKPEHARRFQAYWKDLVGGTLPEVALRQAFPLEELRLLDRELAAFVAKLP